MADRSTFFIIDRCIFDNWVSEDKPFDKFHAWVYMIGHANYSDKTKLYKGKIQVVKRGELVTSQRKLAEDFGWSRAKVRTFLDALEADGMVTVKRTTDHTTITIENYGKFQDYQPTKRTTDHTTDRTTECTTDRTYKNKVNKENKENNISPEIPSREVVSTFISKMGFNVDADKFCDYYESCEWTDSKGKPIRDWKRMVRTWDNNKPVVYQSKTLQTPMDKIIAELKEKMAKEAATNDD